jgi:hypothetical protein
VTRAKISEYSATANDNTDVNGVNIAEGCPPSSMNNMGREIMAALKRFQVGSDGDGVTVGGSLVVSGSTTANTFSATNVSASGNLTFTGTGNRITGDFSNATIANRVAFQTSTTNGSTVIHAIPNGTGPTSGFEANNNSDITNSSAFQVFAGVSDLSIRASIRGTGTYLPMTFYTGGSEKMRIGTSGLVGIGIANGTSKLEVAGPSANNAGARATYEGTVKINEAGLFSLEATGGLEFKGSVFGSGYGVKLLGTDDGALLIGTRNNSATWTERMRIDSGGNLLVGKATLNTTGNGFTVEPNANGAGIPGSWLTGNSTNDAHGGYHMYSSSSSSYKFYATYAGKVYAVTTTIQGISDQRLKENIEDIDVGLEQILALRPRKFDWKEGKGKDIKGDRGWIAQEFEQVFPEMVDTWLDEPPEGEEPYKSVGADLIPVLVKAIQELKAQLDESNLTLTSVKAELDTVKAELATLKG